MNIARRVIQMAGDADRDVRMSAYPFIVAAAVADAGGKLEISSKATRECWEELMQRNYRPLVIETKGDAGGLVITFQENDQGQLRREESHE